MFLYPFPSTGDSDGTGAPVGRPEARLCRCSAITTAIESGDKVPGFSVEGVQTNNPLCAIVKKKFPDPTVKTITGIITRIFCIKEERLLKQRENATFTGLVGQLDILPGSA